jgi:acyl dehydratase
MNRDELLSHVFADIHTSYSKRDTMLYALGVGAAVDPLDLNDLRFVYEKELQALPSICCVLAHPGGWITAPKFEVNYVKLLHAEQSFQLLKPLPAEGEVIGKYRITGIVDKGADSGALLYMEKSLHEPGGDLIGTVGSSYFLRGDGGGGNWGTPAAELPVVPERPADGSLDLPTLPIAALIYRLSGDYNPLHADPAIARKAGFEKPILHGLCTYGVACQSLVRGPGGGDATRLRGMGARFTKPVYPGETIRTEWWRNGSAVQFRCSSVERNLVVLDRGTATIVD